MTELNGGRFGGWVEGGEERRTWTVSVLFLILLHQNLNETIPNPNWEMQLNWHPAGMAASPSCPLAVSSDTYSSTPSSPIQFWPTSSFPYFVLHVHAPVIRRQLFRTKSGDGFSIRNSQPISGTYIICGPARRQWQKWYSKFWLSANGACDKGLLISVFVLMLFVLSEIIAGQHRSLEQRRRHSDRHNAAPINGGCIKPTWKQVSRLPDLFSSSIVPCLLYLYKHARRRERKSMKWARRSLASLALFGRQST